MARFVPAEQTGFARRLRREMTAAETMVWRALRAGRLSGAKFRRQVPIGPYVADFLCFEARLIVELDGPPHDDQLQIQRDRDRDAWFSHQGFKTLRFTNDLALGGTELLVKEIEGVLSSRAAPAATPSSVGLRPPPSPARGEGTRP